jgi:hypothetical protein
VNFEFTIPFLPEPTQYQPTKLIELASTQLNIKISLPTVDKVLEAIKLRFWRVVSSGVLSR